ncbi:hypothetical protein NFI96_010733 [Prochilodus magdalenae]|nr:hypothetical protein NFI96_010733 [Prochilodus magdalenae]
MDSFRAARDNNQPQPYSGGPAVPGAGSYALAGGDGFGIGAPPGSAPPPPPPWPVQHSHWPPFQAPVPPGGPSPYSQPPVFDPSRPPPGYFGEQQTGHWPPPASRGQQLPPVSDRGEFDHQGGGFANFGPPPPPAYQPCFPPVSSSGPNFSGDHHKPSSTFPHLYASSESTWPGESHQNQPNREHSSSTTTRPVISDPEAEQRVQDQRWIKGFLQRRGQKASAAAQAASSLSVSDFRQKLYGAVQVLSELSLLCQTLKDNLENESAWGESHSRAVELRSSLQETLPALQDQETISRVRKKLELIKKKRVRMRRRKAERMEEKLEEERRAAEREAAMDKYQMKQIQELEEKNRERELKLAADAVLSEVRKKQADAKRMLDILKALEKLRKLRKEAASRKGMFPEKECDEVFDGHLTRLRSLIRKRTAVYGAEEKALRVMLEGEQEEERKRDREKRLKKEREKLLLRKQEIDAMLFGAVCVCVSELPPDHPLQPFREYYTQAERSVPALIQIRREWDQFLVPVDHPDGTSIPQGWVLPDPPADDVWASALEK